MSPKRFIWLTPLLFVGLAFTGLFWFAMVFSILADQVLLAQIQRTVQASMMLALPAAVLFIACGWPDDRMRDATRWTWRFLWGGALVFFWIHFVLSMILYRWNVVHFFELQGVALASFNILVLLWWSIDGLLLWRREGRLLVLQRRALVVVLSAGFVLASVYLKSGFVKGLGVAYLVAVLVAAAYRLAVVNRAASAPRSDPPIPEAGR